MQRLSYTAHWLKTSLIAKSALPAGTNLFGAIQLASEMKSRETGSIVTLLCDSGERYLDTYFNPDWIQHNVGDLQPYLRKLSQFEQTSQI